MPRVKFLRLHLRQNRVFCKFILRINTATVELVRSWICNHGKLKARRTGHEYEIVNFAEVLKNFPIITIKRKFADRFIYRTHIYVHRYIYLAKMLEVKSWPMKWPELISRPIGMESLLMDYPTESSGESASLVGL